MDSGLKYQHLFDQIKTAFDQKYVSADGHVFGNTQTGYCMALQFDLLPDELRPNAAEYLKENVESHQDHLTTGFVGVSHLLPALCSEGEVDTAYKVFEQDTFPSWLFSVKHGATTIWERWDGWTPEKGFQDIRMNSFNHYSLGSCGEWMFDTVAGIGVDPTQPGFSDIIIRPRPGGDLTEAHGSFDSIHGKISSDWKLQNGRMSLHLIVPVNTMADVSLPTSDPASVRESGLPIAKHPEIQVPAKELPNEQHYVIGSGNYSFTCKFP
jgi:alpha-L-rhamnosidase